MGIMAQNAEDRLYLIDFVRGLMEYSEEKRGRQTTFLPSNHMAWHVFLWVLKEE